MIWWGRSRGRCDGRAPIEILALEARIRTPMTTTISPGCFVTRLDIAGHAVSRSGERGSLSLDPNSAACAGGEAVQSKAAKR